MEELGIDYPVVCQMCEERFCTQCPHEAISVGSLGRIVISKERCTGCGECEALCPVGAIELGEDVPLVCDLCGGDPQCIKTCSLNAIVFDSSLYESVKLSEEIDSTSESSTETKRVRFAVLRTQYIRGLWKRKGES